MVRVDYDWNPSVHRDAGIDADRVGSRPRDPAPVEAKDRPAHAPVAHEDVRTPAQKRKRSSGGAMDGAGLLDLLGGCDRDEQIRGASDREGGQFRERYLEARRDGSVHVAWLRSSTFDSIPVAPARP